MSKCEGVTLVEESKTRICRVSKTDSNNDKGTDQLCCQFHSEYCGTDTSVKVHLKKSHSPEFEKFDCEICWTEFRSRKDMLKHRKSHKNGDGKFECNTCNKTVLCYNYFINHLKIHDIKLQSKNLNSPVVIESNESVDEKLRKGQNKLESVDSDVDKNKKKWFTCDTCGKRFNFACLLRDHINLHTGSKPYSCQKCGKDFSQKASLKQHARTHREVHPFVCRVCSKGFFNRGDLKKHERIHTKERPYVCEMCGEGFIQSSHLTTHRRSHSSLRPHGCDICPRKFSKKGDLTRHRRIHTGELPFLCQVCGKKFRQSYQCQNHVKNHHPNLESNQPSENSNESLSSNSATEECDSSNNEYNVLNVNCSSTSLQYNTSTVYHYSGVSNQQKQVQEYSQHVNSHGTIFSSDHSSSYSTVVTNSYSNPSNFNTNNPVNSQSDILYEYYHNPLAKEKNDLITHSDPSVTATCFSAHHTNNSEQTSCHYSTSNYNLGATRQPQNYY